MTATKKPRGIIQQYISLTKPGVLFGNVITGAAGFGLASTTWGVLEPLLFLATIGGMTLVIAAACALNNALDADIDRIMPRTKTRAVASGAIPKSRAVIFAVILLILGEVILFQWAGWLVAGIGAAGFVIYVWLYGALAKRHSVHGTLVGGVSGALPILAGYCAVTGFIDPGAILVFAALFFWQLPEFYSISIYRHDEYKAAGVPVMSVKAGIWSTKIQIFIYTLLFLAAALLLTFFGYTHYVYLAVMALVGGYWLALGLEGLRRQAVEADNKWSRSMFKFSLTVVLVYSAMIVLGPLLP